ncbi:MAG: AI-2E family transporter [Thioalkalivibrionaceae bacterium]
MFDMIRRWYLRHFTDPQVVLLAILLLLGFFLIVFIGSLLAPILASIVIAYLLEGAVGRLCRLGLPRLLAVNLVFVAFLASVALVLFVLFPMLSTQVTQLVRELPGIVVQLQNLLLQLPEHYPNLITEEQVRDITGAVRAEAILLGQRVVSFSLSSAQYIVVLLIYLVVVPLMVFFMLKDRDLILKWFLSFLPQDRRLVSAVWSQINVKLASYVRGKFIEILIVWGVTFATFQWFGLQYAMLLSFLVGISVIVPYIGAAIVTIPVAIVGYFQFGLSGEFAWLMIAYGVIQFLDGNVLVPILFSEVVNLHPVAIVTAVFVFGGIFGLWGVFFAIPLATVVHVVLDAWPRHGLVTPDGTHADLAVAETDAVISDPPSNNRDGA